MFDSCCLCIFSCYISIPLIMMNCTIFFVIISLHFSNIFVSVLHFRNFKTVGDFFRIHLLSTLDVKPCERHACSSTIQDIGIQ